jgi:transposase
MSQNGKHPETIPEVEVEPRAVARHFTREYKKHILEMIDAASEPGEMGEILRREGLYSQIISKWRQQREHGHLEGSLDVKRGPKPVPETRELIRLQRENERLRVRLERAELIIEVQKKVSGLLGLDESEQSEPK